MTKKEEEILSRLEDNVFVECTIECGKCRKGESGHMFDSYEFAEAMFRKGWSFKRDMALCPECNKKKK